MGKQYRWSPEMAMQSAIDKLKEKLGITKKSKQFVMKNPLHPGQHVKELLDYLGVSVTKAALHMGVSRDSLSRLINGKKGISADMALRLSIAFGSTYEFWLNLDHDYKLSKCVHSKPIRIKRLEKETK